MAICPFADHKLIPPGANDPRIKVRAAVLHVDAGNADSLYGLFSGDQNTSGLESHFFVKKDGTIEQYRDTAYQADAAYASNDFAVQIETQGYGAGEWTSQQFASIKKLLTWVHQTHGVPLRKIQQYDGSGVGYHCQFKEWNLSNHSCPGPDRVNQFNNLLVPWLNGYIDSRPAGPTHVSVGKQKLLDGLAELDKASPKRVGVRALAASIRTLVNRLPAR